MVPAGTDMAAAMEQVAQQVARDGGRAYVIPGGGSNALGGLGYVACAQELRQQCFEMGLHFDRLVVGSGSSGTHGGWWPASWASTSTCRIVGIGVSRDPADQEPLVHREAQAVDDLLGLGLTVPREAVRRSAGTGSPSIRCRTRAWSRRCNGWHAPRTAARPGLHRQGHGRADRPGARGLLRAGERVLFLHTGGLPSLFAFEDTLRGAGELAP